jgi:hypothetical protein
MATQQELAFSAGLRVTLPYGKARASCEAKRVEFNEKALQTHLSEAKRGYEVTGFDEEKGIEIDIKTCRGKGLADRKFLCAYAEMDSGEVMDLLDMFDLEFSDVRITAVAFVNDNVKE